jgi:hypothetical protein
MNSIILKIKFWHLLIFEFTWWCICSYICSNIFKHDFVVVIFICTISSMVITVITLTILILIDDYRWKRYIKSQQSYIKSQLS